MQGDNQDTGLDGGHRRRNERFRGTLHHMLEKGRAAVISDGGKREHQEEQAGNVLIPLALAVEMLEG